MFTLILKETSTHLKIMGYFLAKIFHRNRVQMYQVCVTDQKIPVNQNENL